MIILSALVPVYIAAIAILLRHGAPRPFPWWAVYILAISLARHGTQERLFYFMALVSTIIIVSRIRAMSERWDAVGKWIALALAVWLLLDAARIIPAPDVILADDTIGPLRRPYALEHPNNLAAWMLLMPWGLWTPAAIVLTQSRGALFGFAPALILRAVPRRWLTIVCMIGAVLGIVALAFRPGTVFARLDLWQDGIRLFLSSPIMGHGTGSYAALGSYQLDTAHNAMITIAAENGLFGLIPMIWMLIAAGREIARSPHPAKWGLMAFWIQQMFDDQWLHPITSILLGIAAAVCIFHRGD